MARGQSRARVGALLILAACFLVSALIRVGEVVAALPASDEKSGLINEPASKDTKSALAGGKDDVRAPSDVIAELRKQRELLAAREAEIVEREQQLRALNARLKDRLDQLKAERKRLEETAALVNDAAGKDVRRLAVMYGQMKPKQAAQIFDQMAPSFAAGFMSEMRPEAAALILANMAAERAYAVSLLMAGRNVERDKDAPAAADGPEE